MKTEEDKLKACRLARAIASDISLYNEAKIQEALEQDNFFEALDQEIDVGRTLYRDRIGTELYRATNYFDRAIVDMVLARKGYLKTPFW
ncbi:MAG: hypothetical protein LBM75_04470 [Myxococcales bacterium]|nr:hypothetical protein [Myxococcales bacterium]